MLAFSLEKHAPGCLKKKSNNVCGTRRVQPITGLNDYEDFFIICVSSSFNRLIASFDFIAILVLTRSIVDLTLPVTELLQGKEIDMADASYFFDSLIVVLAK